VGVGALLQLSLFLTASRVVSQHMFQYAGDGRQDLRRLRQGVIRYRCQLTGKPLFVQANIHGAGDGVRVAHLIGIGKLEMRGVS
jgi:hypothetical protein